MHPNAFLRSFWNMNLRPQVFVAMSFDPAYAGRFKRVIEPAVAAITVNGAPLAAYRVDLSKSGDSILTDITDGIAHSQFILADVSTLGRDAQSGRPYRNGNVMYEVGIALAARHPSDVLLVRDDDDPLLFDVTVIPHAKIDFEKTDEARALLQNLLIERLREQQRVRHAKIEIAIASLSAEEMNLINRFALFPVNKAWNYPKTDNVNFEAQVAIPRLLDKGMIIVSGRFVDGHPAYRWTELGRIAAMLAKDSLPQLAYDQTVPATDQAPSSAKG
jgi:hypothetical protein